MATHSAAFKQFVTIVTPAKGNNGRTFLMRGCALSALALGLTLFGTASFAGCLTIGSNYPCTGITDETLNAGPGDNLVYSGGARGSLTVNGEGGNDSIVFGEASTLTAKSGPTIVDAGEGDDSVTVQGASDLMGDIRGGSGADNILVEESSSVDGSIEGGLGNDILTLRDAGTTVTGNLLGGFGADTIMLRDASTLNGDIDAGDGADKITLKLGTKVEGDLLAGADSDTVLIRGASEVKGDVDTGDGADLLTIHEGSVVKGSVYGGDGDDIVLLEGNMIIGGSTIEGDFDAGAGNDILGIRSASTVLGDVLGGTGDDALLITDRSNVGGDVDAGDGNDLVTVQDLSVVKGSVLGGAGSDSLLVEGNATVEGSLSGDAGNDLITVTSGEVRGGISGGDGDDTANLSGGKIGGLDDGSSLDLGAGDDILNLTFDDTLGADAIDLTAVLNFNGGTGSNVATVTGFDGSYSEGGLFYRQFDRWDNVTAVGSNLQFSSDASITALNLTSSSALFQTTGMRALTGADGSDTAELSVDATSYIDLRDTAFDALLTVLNLSLFDVLPPPLPQSKADDSITAADLSLTGSATPMTLPTLRVDFDADDQTYRNGRDDAVSGNADQIDVSTTITTTGTVGIRIDAVGGYLDSGMPVGLSGSVAIIDDLQSAALTRPGVAATLFASTTYVPVSDMPVDPARQWALVDQGNGGVYLQWTTVIDEATVGPNAGAELAVASGGVDAMSTIISGLADGSIATRPVCVEAKVDCAFSPASVWVSAGNSILELRSVESFEGLDTSNWTLTGGVEYALGEMWSGGVFASLQKGSTDLGSVQGAFGPRKSSADQTSVFVGGYVKAEQNSAYVTALGAVGKASTDLINGTLFDATSTHDSFVGLFAATAGKRMALGSGLEIDPRIEASYVTSNGDEYRDSEGLFISSAATQARIAATVGLTYQKDTSPLSLTMRAGTAFLLSNTEVDAGEFGVGSTVGVSGHRSDKVFTASVAGRWTFSDNASLVGSLSADTGEHIRAARGALMFTYSF